MSKKLIRVCSYGNSIVLVALAFYYFIFPLSILINILRDPSLHDGSTSRFLYTWHHQLSEKLEPWATARLRSGRASELSMNDISGTEWPIFSAVYYLWATDALQVAWQNDPTLYPIIPSEYAKGAIEAAAAIVADPTHATWVKNHWGDDYLNQENLFYRMLLISGLTSYQKLLNNHRYEQLLLTQVESLAQELDESPFGLLDDYPGQCYPIDILPAIAAIQRADEVLDTDHSAFITHAIRAFEGARLDPDTQLPAYVANSLTGKGLGPARGVGISYMLIWAPELWPETAQNWYGRYENHFWQESPLAVGIREFSRYQPYPEWLLDVDAGPVLAGYGTAASAFGIGAARVNGRFDQAYPLSAEALIISWPLSNGTLLGARALSNLSDAPFIGETALLFNMSRPTITDIHVSGNDKLPRVVYLGLSLYAFAGLIIIAVAIRAIQRWRTRSSNLQFPQPRLQLMGWILLVLIGTLTILSDKATLGLAIILAGQLLPRGRYTVKHKAND